ncbi:MAG: prepilin-type N-terminal cleavage/methylation domain-containing protein [Patescibacteria group bacterium]
MSFFSQKSVLKRRAMPKSTTGFTLVELMVVVAIFAILTTIILYKNSDFNNSFLLTDAAYDVALTVREAQVYGINVKSTGKGAANQYFNSGYGIYLDTTGTYPNTLVFFADAFTSPSVSAGNYTYDGQSEFITAFALNRGYTISQFCAKPSIGQERCSTTPDAPLNRLAIVFVRPNPDAKITDSGGGTEYSSATITITSPDGTKSKTVRITTAGQISIN